MISINLQEIFQKWKISRNLPKFFQRWKNTLCLGHSTFTSSMYPPFFSNNIVQVSETTQLTGFNVTYDYLFILIYSLFKHICLLNINFRLWFHWFLNSLYLRNIISLSITLKSCTKLRSRQGLPSSLIPLYNMAFAEFITVKSIKTIHINGNMIEPWLTPNLTTKLTILCLVLTLHLPCSLGWTPSKQSVQTTIGQNPA